MDASLTKKTPPEGLTSSSLPFPSYANTAESMSGMGGAPMLLTLEELWGRERPAYFLGARSSGEAVMSMSVTLE